MPGGKRAPERVRRILALGSGGVIFINFHYPMTGYFTFDIWMARLRKDCGRRRKLLVTDSIYVLQTLWSSGVEPTLEAIIEQADSVSHLTMPEFSDVKLGRLPH
jgi:hypothetical protein